MSGFQLQRLGQIMDRRDDLGLPDRFEVYYGMTDNRIGAALLDLPEYARGARRSADSAR